MCNSSPFAAKFTSGNTQLCEIHYWRDFTFNMYCACEWMHTRAHATAWVRMPKNKLILSFYNMGPRDQTHVLELSNEPLHPRSPPAGPHFLGRAIRPCKTGGPAVISVEYTCWGGKRHCSSETWKHGGHQSWKRWFTGRSDRQPWRALGTLFGRR